MLITVNDYRRLIGLMDSRVLVRDLSSGKEAEITVVYPKDADKQQSKISVFSKIGIALLGQQRGDIVSWIVPAGKGQFEILQITYQPEAVGNYYS
jgi:regulator of nucleoside diphosphate kinase